MKKHVLFFLLSFVCLITNAQTYIKTDFTKEVPLSIMGILEGEKWKTDVKTDKASIKCISFGAKGRTIILRMAIPKMRDELIEQGDLPELTYSYSGSNVYIRHAIGKDGTDAYTIKRGDLECAGLVKTVSGWIALISSNEQTHCVSDLCIGMTKEDVQKKCDKLGGTQFKFIRNSGTLKVYSLLWLDMEKQYNWNHSDYGYSVTNNKVYGDFYFNAQNKLVKWLLYN